MARQVYDLSHFTIQLGKIGRLQTLSRIPVIAGDSIRLQAAGVWKMSPLRRDLILDSKVDLFAFFVPHRHIYGDRWLDFIRQGNDESQTFPVHSTGARANPFLACNERGVLPMWIPAGYNRIWNRYFRPPTDDSAIRADDRLPNSFLSDDNLFGIKCGWLPRLFTATVDDETGTSDETVDLDGSRLSLLKLAQAKAHLRTEREREFFSQRYIDVMDHTWGTTVNIDADQRPGLCWRSSFWLSGYDIDGTAGDSLGQYSGKSMALGGMRMPSKFFNEHGCLWIMALVRFPTIFAEEKHYLDGKANFSYKELAADPEILRNEPPMTINANDFFEPGGDNNVGKRAYGDWYREHQSFVHRRFDSLHGFPFSSIFDSGITKDDLRFVDSEHYDEIFQTTQQGHYRAQLRMDVMAKRYVPKPQASIFAGAS